MISLIGRFACLIAFGMQLMVANEVQEVLDELTNMGARSLLMRHPTGVWRGRSWNTVSKALEAMAILEGPVSEEFLQEKYGHGRYGLTFIKTNDIPNKILDDTADLIGSHGNQHAVVVVTRVKYQGQDGFILTSKNKDELCFVNNSKSFLEGRMPFTNENIQKAIEDAQIIYTILRAECPATYELAREHFEELMQEIGR